jgi:hypothetical protein
MRTQGAQCSQGLCLEKNTLHLHISPYFMLIKFNILDLLIALACQEKFEAATLEAMDPEAKGRFVLSWMDSIDFPFFLARSSVFQFRHHFLITYL